MTTDEVLKLAREEAMKTVWKPKSVKNMTINQTEIDLEKAIELLKESVYFINIMVNTTYDGPNYTTSYELASEIDKFLNQIDEK